MTNLFNEQVSPDWKPDFLADEAWWAAIPDDTTALLCPNGMDASVIVKGPDGATGHPKLVRFIRQYDAAGDTLRVRVDYARDPSDERFTRPTEKEIMAIPVGTDFPDDVDVEAAGEFTDNIHPEE